MVSRPSALNKLSAVILIERIYFIIAKAFAVSLKFVVTFAVFCLTHAATLLDTGVT